MLALRPRSEQTEFDVVMTGFGDKKLDVVKVVKSLTGSTLMEAKKLVESAPVTIKEKQSRRKRRRRSRMNWKRPAPRSNSSSQFGTCGWRLAPVPGGRETQVGDSCCHNLWFLKRKFVLVNVQGEVRTEAASGAHFSSFSPQFALRRERLRSGRGQA